MTFTTFWFTNIYNRLLLEVALAKQKAGNSRTTFFTRSSSSSFSSQKIILRNGSEMFEYWTNPPIDPIIKVYVFNYTNILEIANGVDELIRLEEVGPWTYSERVVKTGLIYEGGKVTFKVSLFSCHSLMCCHYKYDHF